MGNDNSAEYERVIAQKERMTEKAHSDTREAESRRRALEKEMELKLERERDEVRAAESKKEELRRELAAREREAAIREQMQQNRADAAEKRTENIQDKMMQKIEAKNKQLVQAEQEKAAAVEAAKDQLVQVEREKATAVEAVKDQLAQLQREKATAVVAVYEMLLAEKDKRVEEQKQIANTATEMNKMMISNQTKQQELMSGEMRSLTESFSRTPTIGQSSGSDGVRSLSEIRLKKPHVIIMDNIAPHDSSRKCVKRDQVLMKEMFKSIGADVAPIKRGQNLAIALEDCEEEDYSDYDGIIVAVFSTGTAMILDDGGNLLSVHSICQSFARIPSLDKKPKIIFVHATEKSIETLPTTEQENTTVDTLMCYCELTEEFYVENLHEKHGSYFVRGLGHAFHTKKGDHIENILNEVQEQSSGLQQGNAFEMRSSLQFPVYFGHA